MKTVVVKLKDSDKKYFRFSGIASTETRDSDGDLIKQKGIDLTLVYQGKAIVNAEHDEPSIGAIEKAELIDGALYIEGIVYIKTIKAKQFYDLLLEDNPSKPVTLSIEFVNPVFSKKDKSVFNEILLTGVALIGIRDEPSNKFTFAELLKAFTKKQILEELLSRAKRSKSFKAQLIKLLNN